MWYQFHFCVFSPCKIKASATSTLTSQSQAGSKWGLDFTRAAAFCQTCLWHSWTRSQGVIVNVWVRNLEGASLFIADDAVLQATTLSTHWNSLQCVAAGMKSAPLELGLWKSVWSVLLQSCYSCVVYLWFDNHRDGSVSVEDHSFDNHSVPSSFQQYPHTASHPLPRRD